MDLHGALERHQWEDSLRYLRPLHGIDKHCVFDKNQKLAATTSTDKSEYLKTVFTVLCGIGKWKLKPMATADKLSF